MRYLAFVTLLSLSACDRGTDIRGPVDRHYLHFDTARAYGDNVLLWLEGSEPCNGADASWVRFDGDVSVFTYFGERDEGGAAVVQLGALQERLAADFGDRGHLQGEWADDWACEK